MTEDDPTREFVLRALAASEIAESTTRPDLRQAFTQLTETWLERAADAGAADEA